MYYIKLMCGLVEDFYIYVWICVCYKVYTNIVLNFIKYFIVFDVDDTSNV